MKHFFIGLLTLISIPSFADTDFDRMFINEIYDRGYMLVATINEKAGIRFNQGSKVARLDSGIVTCWIGLKQSAEKDSIIKKGSQIKLEANGRGFVGTELDGLLSKSSSTIAGIDFHWAYTRSPKLEDIKRWCAKVTFEVVENDTLEEIKPDFTN